VGLRILESWGPPGEPRDTPLEEALFDPSLAIGRYEADRPSESDACRIGDARILAMRPDRS
jgi:hydrogenase maturation protease